MSGLPIMFSDIVVTSVIVSILYLVYRIHHAKRKCHHAKRKQIHALPDKIQDPRSRIRDPRYVITNNLTRLVNDYRCPYAVVNYPVSISTITMNLIMIS